MGGVVDWDLSPSSLGSGVNESGALVEIQGPLPEPYHRFAFPPVCDTLYLSHDSGARPAAWVAAVLAAAEGAEGEKVAVLANGGCVPGSDAEDASAPAVWTVRRGKLDGFSSYRFVWDGRGRWRGVTVLCAPPKAEGDPWRWFVMLRAEILWDEVQRGGTAASLTRVVLAGLGNPETGDGLLAESYPLEQWRVARFDVCRDHGGYQWSLMDLGRFATRSPSWSRGMSQMENEEPEAMPASDGGWTYGNPDGSTFYLGRRRSTGRFLRIYCKTTESRAKGSSPRWEPYWRWALLGSSEAQGPLPKVWRAEVEFGGGWLRAHGFTSAALLEGAEEALWGYYVDAVRHTKGETTQLRHENPSPIWTLLARPWRPTAAAWTYTPRREVVGERDLVHLTKQAAGCMARVVEQLHQPDDADAVEAAILETLLNLAPRLRAKALGLLQARTAEDEERGGTRGERIAATPHPGEDPFT